MKKAISAMLLLALILSLTACGKNEGENSIGKTAVVSEPGSALIRLGTINYTNLETAVNLFNSENEFGIKIEIIDYRDGISDGDIRQQAINRLNMEIAAGEGPDIIDFETIPGRSNYLKQGFLLDMSPYFERDINSENYYILDDINPEGRYYFAQSFLIMCLYGLESTFGDRTGWTLQEYIDLVSKPQYEFNHEVKDSFIERMIIYGVLPQFVDYKNGKCNFDSPEFSSLLKYAGSLHDSYQDSDDVYSNASLASGEKLYNDYAIQNPADINILEQEEGAELSFIGYPTSDGKNGTFLYLTGLMGVSSNTKHPAEVWEFIKFFIDDENVQGKAALTSIPVKKSVLSGIVDELQHPYKEFEGKEISINEDGTFNVDGVYQDSQYNPEPIISEKQLSKFYKLIDQSKTPYEYDKKIHSIIKESAQRYFSGEQSLDKTTKDIQSRVELYLAENK